MRPEEIFEGTKENLKEPVTVNASECLENNFVFEEALLVNPQHGLKTFHESKESKGEE